MDDCIFGYSNKNIDGIMYLTHLYKKINSTRATNAYRFSQKLASLADRLLAKVFHTYDYSVDRITGVSSNPDGERIYGFMQCNSYISINDCVSCLNHAKNELLSCCDKVVGASYQTPSCAFCFGIYPFFNRISFSHTGMSNKTKTIIINVCAVVALLVLTHKQRQSLSMKSD